MTTSSRPGQPPSSSCSPRASLCARQPGRRFLPCGPRAGCPAPRGWLVAGGAIDGIGLEDLVGLDAQRARVVANVTQFVAGLPANNMLLWGARGTGKSSLVHGVLNHFSDQGLRLLEVERDALGDLPEISERLGALPYRFYFSAMTCPLRGASLATRR